LQDTDFSAHSHTTYLGILSHRTNYF